MNQKLLISLLIVPAILIQFSASYNYASANIIGEWNLDAYTYNTSVIPNFKYMKGVKYVFKSDLSGVIYSQTDTINFKWSIKRKIILTSGNGENHKYRILQCTPSELVLVDQYAGLDEYGIYNANEKGLLFSR